MMHHSLSKAVKTDRIKPDASGFTVAAGTTDVNSDIIDTAGWEGVRFIIGFGAITAGAVTSVKAQQGAASNMSDAADLAGSAITVADSDDNKVAIIEIYRPIKRYVRSVIDRGTQNAVVDFELVEYIDSRKQPITEGGNVISAEVNVSPAEGTA